MKIMYADPPYLGCAAKLYGDHPEAHVYDEPAAHQELMGAMEAEADSWALSLHEPSLRVLLPLAPDGVRVGAWVKPFASFKPGVDPAYTWEPVIYRTARGWARSQQTCRDHVVANITLQKGLTGAKPAAFWFWLFELLGGAPRRRIRRPVPGDGGGRLSLGGLVFGRRSAPHRRSCRPPAVPRTRQVMAVGLSLVPMTLGDAQAWVDDVHRHLDAPKSLCYFAVGLARDGEIVGAAIVGRPVARHLCDGWTAEVRRVAVIEGVRNGCSKLYGACWRAARALGYRRLVTYTLDSEPGTSLRAAEWKVVGQTKEEGWDRPSRPRVDRHPTQVKIRWEATSA